MATFDETMSAKDLSEEQAIECLREARDACEAQRAHFLAIEANGHQHNAWKRHVAAIDYALWALTGELRQ